jgi:DNA-binding response OmpR family regulator
LRILIVEDEETLANLIKGGLEDESYSVDVAYDGEEGLFLAENEPFDIIILDIMLPKLNGIELLKKLRKKNISTPVLMLTAKSEIEDKVLGLNSGADDYLTKPFSFDELLARIKAILRRHFNVVDNILKIDDLEINLSTHEVKRGGILVELTAKEYALLEYLALNRNKLLTRTDITEHIYNYDFDLDSNVVDVMITRIRKKIDKGFDKKLIQTVRGSGYMLKE